MRNNGHDPASAPRADATRTDEDLMLELVHGRHEVLGSLCVLAPVAASLFGLGFAVVGVRYMQTQTTLDRDERALTLVDHE